MIKPIKPNISLWIPSEPSPESVTNRLKFSWRRVTCCCSLYVNQTNLNVKLSKNCGAKQGASKKSGRGHGLPGPPLEPPLWRYHCSVMYVTRQWRSYENFSFIVT